MRAFRSLTQELKHLSPRGRRPRFEISKDQVVYLASLSFTWTEIAALLGVSRMTLFRLIISNMKKYGLDR